MLEFTVMYFTLVGGGGVNVQYQQLLAKVGVVEVGPTVQTVGMCGL